MIELEPARWGGVLADLRGLPINTLFIQSVLDRHVEGRIYADDAENPQAFYGVHSYGMALLWGRPVGDRLQEWLRRRLLARPTVTEWLQVYPNSWADAVESLLGDELKAADLPGRALKCTRVNFTFHRDAYLREHAGSLPPLTQGKILPTDAEMFSRIEGSVVPKQFWRNGTQFVQAGGGFSLVIDGEIVSTAFCSFRQGSQLELGIETSQRHRGRGYGRLVARALIDECVRRNLEPVWACRLENTASFELAKKLGFVPTAYLPYYRLPSSA